MEYRLRFSIFCNILVCLSLCGTATAQYNLDTRIAAHVYRDDKIVVRLPDGWKAAVDTYENGSESHGLILTKGQYVLRLCTECGQVSGIIGGRFGEIVGMVQPRFRANMDDPGPCGEEQAVRVNRRLSRVDFWFRRDPSHLYNEAADDCREPKTTATVWYGSYFEERCTPEPYVNCGGYFLHHDWLTHEKPIGMDEMVFALTSDKDDLDQLPHRGDPELEQVLREASSLVRSVRYRKLPKSTNTSE